MASVLSGVDARTKLVGHNRLELLLFRLDGRQRYGINVFKVREVVSCPPLTRLPNSGPAICGITHMRGNTFMIIDLQMAIGRGPVADPRKCSVIVTEYNRTMQGFLVPHIQHIINKNWGEILQPPLGAGKKHYLTAVTKVDEEIVEVLDVEKVLFEITGVKFDDDHPVPPDDAEFALMAQKCHVLVADDSSVARSQIKRTLEKVGVTYTVCEDGQRAFDTLQKWKESNSDEYQRLALLVSDVEMPVMDGYTLTAKVRADPGFAGIKVLLHTSLSGVFDSSALEHVKADGFLSKFDSEELTGFIKKIVAEYVKNLK